LEQVLCAWEDTWFSFNAGLQIEAGLTGLISSSNQSKPIEGPLGSYHRFRNYLKTNMLSDIRQFDRKTFLGDGLVLPRTYSGLYQSIIKHFNYSLHTFPVALASWTMHSRRVFHIAADLQVLLNSTMLDGVLWRDVKLPFKSFAVSLEIPIVDHRGAKYDCILFGEEPRYGKDWEKETYIGVRLFHAKFGGGVRQISPDCHNDIVEAMKRGRWEHAQKTLEYVSKPETNPFFPIRICTYFLDDKVKNYPVTTNIGEIDVDDRPKEFQHHAPPEESIHFDAAARIVVGLCLYLQTLPPSSSARSEWKKHERVGKKPDPRAITNDAQVCTVSCTHKLSAEERQVTGNDAQMRKKSLYELCAHFRRGHWRRPPGQGHIPDAPRIVWVRPTLVRRDRLVDGQLPGGAESILN
jgi:hypothetical protein